MNFKESQTSKNLARAFAGECQAGARYQFIAQTAEQEQQSYLKSLMKSLAKQEMTHAKLFWDLIQKHSKGSAENIEITAGYPYRGGTLCEMLEHSAHNEKSENVSIYPSFAKIAEEEGFEDVANTFKKVALVEHEHFQTLNELHDRYKEKSIYVSENEDEWKCSQCGFSIFNKKAPDICPLCSFPQGSFEFKLTQNKPQ